MVFNNKRDRDIELEILPQKTLRVLLDRELYYSMKDDGIDFSISLNLIRRHFWVSLRGKSSISLRGYIWGSLLGRIGFILEHFLIIFRAFLMDFGRPTTEPKLRPELCSTPRPPTGPEPIPTPHPPHPTLRAPPLGLCTLREVRFYCDCLSVLWGLLWT